jgi:hypothetical protein
MLQYDANEMLLQRVVAASTKVLDVLEQMINAPKATWLQQLTIANHCREDPRDSQCGMRIPDSSTSC